jgi:hypothetical protein
VRKEMELRTLWNKTNIKAICFKNNKLAFPLYHCASYVLVLTRYVRKNQAETTPESRSERILLHGFLNRAISMLEQLLHFYIKVCIPLKAGQCL